MSALLNEWRFVGYVNSIQSAPAYLIPVFGRLNDSSYFIQEIDFEKNRVSALKPVELSLFELKKVDLVLSVYPESDPVFGFIKSNGEILIGTKIQIEKQIYNWVKDSQLNDALCMQIGDIFGWTSLHQEAQQRYISHLRKEAGNSVCRSYINSEVRLHSWKFLEHNFVTKKKRELLQLNLGKLDIFYDDKGELNFTNFSDKLHLSDKTISDLKKEVEFKFGWMSEYFIDNSGVLESHNPKERVIKKSKRKGILLCGGSGTRLHPMTTATAKCLLPIFDKPLIYYSITAMIKMGVRDILIITTNKEVGNFSTLLGDGQGWGVRISYDIQSSPDGIAQALIIAEDYLNGAPCVLLLGDNLFLGEGFFETAFEVSEACETAAIFVKTVKNVTEFGVAELSEKKDEVLSLMEKPQHAKSNYAVCGMYFFDKHASAHARELKPSMRGELEITDLNNKYLSQKELRPQVVSDNTDWNITGNPTDFLNASQYVANLSLDDRMKLSSPEFNSYQNGWITIHELRDYLTKYQKSGYIQQLRNMTATDGVV